MAITDFITWPGSVANAKLIQQKLAAKVKLTPMQNPVRYIAGIDVAFPNKGKTTRAAIVVLSFPSLEMVELTVYEAPTVIPYIPGVLSFREGGAILSALAQLKISPDVLMFDGQGIAHPLGLGVASHIGVILNVPTLGIVKSCLVGKFDEPELTKGSISDLVINNKKSGYVVRSRDKVQPLFVSPGHLITKEQALQLALQCITKYRLPEPTRLADKLSKNQM